MAPVAFFAASILAIAGAIGVVSLGNPFYNVLALVVHLISLAALFLLLRAEFVAAAQIVVYAGAVMVLYVFVVAYVGGQDEAGMNVARMNFSHGDYADHKVVHGHVRSAADKLGRTVGILADLQGPKIRLGRFADGPHVWETGSTVTITVEDVVGTADRVSTTYKGLANDARPGDRLLLCSDGLSNMVPDEAITRILGAHADPQDACTDLITQANAAGGTDNITAVVVYIEEG